MDNNRQALLRNGVVAAAGAAAVNLSVFVVARAGDVDFVVDYGSSSTTVPPAQAVVSSVMPILVGSAVAAAVRQRRHVRRLEVLAMAITLLSLGAPLSMGVGGGTKLALAAMHVVVGAAFVRGTQRATVRRRAAEASFGERTGEQWLRFLTSKLPS